MGSTTSTSWSPPSGPGPSGQRDGGDGGEEVAAAGASAVAAGVAVAEAVAEAAIAMREVEDVDERGRSVKLRWTLR